MSRLSLERKAKQPTDFWKLANKCQIDYSMDFSSRTSTPPLAPKKHKKAKKVTSGAATTSTKTQTAVDVADDEQQRADAQVGAAGTIKVFDNDTVVRDTFENVIWQYEHNGWQDYDRTASDVVEAAYQEWLATPYTDVRAIKSGEWQYQVDFNALQQTNIIHANHTQRSIRRRLLAQENEDAMQEDVMQQE